MSVTYSHNGVSMGTWPGAYSSYGAYADPYATGAATNPAAAAPAAASPAATPPARVAPPTAYPTAAERQDAAASDFANYQGRPATQAQAPRGSPLAASLSGTGQAPAKKPMMGNFGMALGVDPYYASY